MEVGLFFTASSLPYCFYFFFRVNIYRTAARIAWTAGGIGRQVPRKRRRRIKTNLLKVNFGLLRLFQRGGD